LKGEKRKKKKKKREEAEALAKLEAAQKQEPKKDPII
jgi:hypothetical protein